MRKVCKGGIVTKKKGIHPWEGWKNEVWDEKGKVQDRILKNYDPLVEMFEEKMKEICPGVEFVDVTPDKTVDN